MIIGVQNLSTLVSPRDAYAMTMLVNRQLRDHVAPAWDLLPPSVGLLHHGATLPRGDAVIAILDDADQAGDLGWHSEGPGESYFGRVFARPVLSSGGNALTASLSVCSVLSHECAEVLGDAACDRWAQRGDGTLVAMELADPVEGDSYLVTITAGSGESVSGTVSDFVLPAWFDPGAAPGATDYMGLVTAPFEARSTGYVIEMAGGSVTESWGRDYPAWKRATKHHSSARTARRDPAVRAASPPPTALA